MDSYDDYGPGDAFGSFSHGFHETLEQSLEREDDGRRRILLMGTRRSGKSSIQRVVFHKMSPHETLFLESTNEICNREISTSALVRFELLDFPGNFDFDKNNTLVTPERIFNRTGALVFVIDAQDDETNYSEDMYYFVQMVAQAVQVNPHIEYHILVHKVDGDAYLHDDHKDKCMNEISDSITEELKDAMLDVRPQFHRTSIYDHSIFEAFSKIVQTLIPQLNFLEQLLNGLNASCGIKKSFLFDVVSKIYVATDSNPVRMETYELCSDMIDVVIDVSCIYGLKDKGEMLPSNAESASVIKLSNDQVLYLREVNKYLAIVCLMPTSSFEKSGLVEYNFSCFKKAISHILQGKEGEHADAEAAEGKEL